MDSASGINSIELNNTRFESNTFDSKYFAAGGSNSTEERVKIKYYEALPDFVLSYKINEKEDAQIKKDRENFEHNLEHDGLILEHDNDSTPSFVLIYTTEEVLQRYAEILEFKFPTIIPTYEEDKNHGGENNKPENPPQSRNRRESYSLNQFFRIDRQIFPKKRYELFHEYSRAKSYLFDESDREFFPPNVRIAIVNFILERASFMEKKQDEDKEVDKQDENVGIGKLIADGVYNDAYPLHDGHQRNSECQRGKLYKKWANIENWLKYQPLDDIKDYFGIKVALYFSWLGFYTNMLILPSIIGVAVFIYGIATMFTNEYVNTICNANDSVVLCPKCDTCEFTKLSDTCTNERISHILDNNASIFFAIFMALWASIYLELWKRYSATMVHRWGSSDFAMQSEHARPAYLKRVIKSKNQKKKLNPITKQIEPTLGFKYKLPSYLLSYVIILLYIVLSVAVVLSLIVYRMAAVSSNRFFGESLDSQSYKYTILLQTTTAVINLLVTFLLNYFYDHLSKFLTDLEYRRTQTEYDNSLSLKIYLFQFISYYSSLFYIGFVKGKWPGTPARYIRFFGFRQEECSAGGCLMELFIQLSITMVGMQTISAFFENGVPYVQKKYNQYMYSRQNSTPNQKVNAWSRDYNLLAWDSMGLYWEYLEMVIQYGFCTLFVIAFPLGPLFALINNIFELRFDAKKILALYRRPVPQRQSSIGIWMEIMSMLGRLSVFSTAVIIAFSSNFIPRLFHDWKDRWKDMDYVEFFYAYFDTSHFEQSAIPLNWNQTSIEFCRYAEFRTHPNTKPLYARPPHYWQILCCRLGFIIIFQNVAQWLQSFIDWIIPDKPTKLDQLIKRENYFISKKIVREERIKTVGKIKSKFEENLYNKRKTNKNSQLNA